MTAMPTPDIKIPIQFSISSFPPFPLTFLHRLLPATKVCLENRLKAHQTHHNKKPSTLIGYNYPKNETR